MDRIVYLPTAETHPEGTVYVTSYEIVVVQAGYALSDSTQMSMTTVPVTPVQEDFLLPLDLSFKTTVLRSDVVRAAVVGSATGLIGFEEGTLFLGRATGTVQLCFQRTCKSSVSFAASTVFAGPATLLMSGAGGIFPLNSWFTLLLETEFLLPIGSEAGQANGGAFNVGGRFPLNHWAIDVALTRPFKAGEKYPTVPLIAVTYRTL